MKDDGKSTEEIMLTLHISKGHIEKWYSPKVRDEREIGIKVGEREDSRDRR
jgi:hypothetical protein